MILEIIMYETRRVTRCAQVSSQYMDGLRFYDWGYRQLSVLYQYTAFYIECVNYLKY